MDTTRTAAHPEPTATTASALDEIVAATPSTRDRHIDLLRAFAIVVVVLYHWVLSVTFWNADGQLSMPNPLATIPMSWVLTWFLQVMPLFFVVGGFASLAAYRSNPAHFVRRRVGRLLRPTAIFVGAWVAFEALREVFLPNAPSVLDWGWVTFVPLWFVGVYLLVSALVPVTARLHARFGVLVPLVLLALIALNDFARFRLDTDVQALPASLLVFVFAHQLGYFWRDGLFVGARRRAWLITGGAALALFALTSVDPYIRSMVSLPGFSHMNPTTLCIAVLAVFQLGVAELVRPLLSGLVQRRRVWKAVAMINGRAMTILVWHMTAWVMAVGVLTVLGFEMLRDPTAHWWLGRPAWVIVPGLFLVPLLAIFGRFELSLKPKTSKPKTSTR